MLLELKVPDMACVACANKITEAILAIAPQAEVKADAQTKLVIINSDLATDKIKAAIIAAGYTVSN